MTSNTLNEKQTKKTEARKYFKILKIKGRPYTVCYKKCKTFN